LIEAKGIIERPDNPTPVTTLSVPTTASRLTVRSMRYARASGALGPDE
jgi:hypothetical protein